jgi:hypothetical protein
VPRDRNDHVPSGTDRERPAGREYYTRMRLTERCGGRGSVAVPLDPVGQPMPFASQTKPKLLHYEVARFVRAFFASSRFCATFF